MVLGWKAGRLRTEAGRLSRRRSQTIQWRDTEKQRGIVAAAKKRRD